MPCQISYAAVRAVTLAGGSTILAQLKALEAATPGTMPEGYQSSLLAIQSEAAQVITDPKTTVGFTVPAGGFAYGTELLDWTPAGGDVLCYFGQRGASAKQIL